MQFRAFEMCLFPVQIIFAPSSWKLVFTDMIFSAFYNIKPDFFKKALNKSLLKIYVFSHQDCRGRSMQFD